VVAGSARNLGRLLFDGEQVVGPSVLDRLGDLSVGGDRLDEDQRVIQTIVLVEQIKQERGLVELVALVVDGLICLSTRRRGGGES